ncbi:hypothetical protein [Kangiella sp. M94]
MSLIIPNKKGIETIKLRNNNPGIACLGFACDLSMTCCHEGINVVARKKAKNDPQVIVMRIKAEGV